MAKETNTKKQTKNLMPIYIIVGILLGGALYLLPSVRAVIVESIGLQLVIISIVALIALGLGKYVLNMAKDDEPELEDEELEITVTQPIHPDTYNTMKPRDFEHEVAWLINALTDYKAVVASGTGDGGVDIKIYKGKKFVGIARCKRHKPGVVLAPMFVRELHSTKKRMGVRMAYLVTTARFTDDTQKEAQALGIKLLDGDDIARMQVKAKAAV